MKLYVFNNGTWVYGGLENGVPVDAQKEGGQPCVMVIAVAAYLAAIEAVKSV